MSAPKIIDTRTRGLLGEASARAGELAARALFQARGNRGQVKLTERELAMVAGTAAHMAHAMTGRQAVQS